MGLRHEWADDSHLIMNMYIEYPWTWEEYNKSVDEVFFLLRSLKKPCATAVDVSKMGVFPNGNIMGNLQRMEKHMPDNVFASVVVGAPYMVMVFMNVLMKVRPRVRRLAIYADTMEEAHYYIMERYQRLYVEKPASQSRRR